MNRDDEGSRIASSFAVSTLAVLVLVNALNIVDRNMFGLLLPDIKRDIRLSDAELGLLGGPAFALTYALAGVPIAWLADKMSRRNIIALGLTFWSFATAATGWAGSAMQLFLARIMLGLGQATNTAPASAMIGDWFPGRFRPMALAFFTTGGPAGIMLGFPLVGWIAEHHGWRMAFVAMGGTGLAVMLLMLLIGREPVREHHRTRDAAVQPLPFREAMALLAHSRAFLVMLFAGVMLSIANAVMNIWVPSFLVRVRGLSVQETGAFIGLYRGLFGVVAAILGGYVVSMLGRNDHRWLAWVPAALCLAMCPAELLFIWAGGSLGWQVGLAADTLLMSIVTPCTFGLVLMIVDPRMRALGTSVYLMVFSLVGQSIGSVAVGMLNDWLSVLHGDMAIRYSMMIAPIAMAVTGVGLFILSAFLAEPAGRQARAGA